MRGLHLIAELYECRCESRLLDDAETLRDLCLAVCTTPGLTPVGQVFHQFGSLRGPAGATGAVVLAESHLAVPHLAGGEGGDAGPLRLQFQPG